jgi:putative restriction endonuclease
MTSASLRISGRCVYPGIRAGSSTTGTRSARRCAARIQGIDPGRLSDFLGLDLSVLKASLRQWVEQNWKECLVSPETERILLAAAWVGQHVFATQVLANCGSWCGFCGPKPTSFGTGRMLLAGHIKPWKDSASPERPDRRNGLVAGPAHVGFDTGVLIVNGGLCIHLAENPDED